MLAVIFALTTMTQLPGAEFDFSDLSRKEDAITATIDHERVVFTIVSPGGIGGARIHLKAGDWPKEIVFLAMYSNRQGFKYLEEFRLKTAHIQASGSLGMSGRVPFTFLDGKGTPDPRAVGSEGGTLALKIVKTGRGMEVRLPPHMLAGSTSLEVNWIDAFRN